MHTSLPYISIAELPFPVFIFVTSRRKAKKAINEDKFTEVCSSGLKGE